MTDSLPLPRIGDTIKAEHIAAISKALRKRTPLNSPFVKVRETPGGFYLEASRASLSTGFRGAWYPTRVNAEIINLTAGSITDGITTRIPTVTNIVVNGTAAQYIHLVCQLTPTIVDGYVTGGTIDSATVQAFSSLQTNTNTTGYVLLCTWKAGVLIARYKYFSMQGELGNRNTGDTVFRVWDQ